MTLDKESANRDLLDKHEVDMWRCARCSMCKFPPLARVKSPKFYYSCCSIDYGNFHTWSGGGKLALGFALQQGRLEDITEKMREAILQCTLCRACDVTCKYSTNMEVQESIFDLRRFMVQTIGPHPAHKMYADNADKFHNVYGESHKSRQDWIKETNAIPDPKSTNLFFTGCTSAYRQQDMVQASVEILKIANYDFQLSDDEYCCGSPIYRAGMVDRAIKFFEHNLEMFENHDIKQVITACPGCYSMFTVEYPKFLDKRHFKIWESIEFKHMTQVVSDLIGENKVKPKEFNKKKYLVTYHDPCHLGREGEPWIPEWEGETKKVLNQITIYDPPRKLRRGTNGIYNPPRKILKFFSNHLEFVEMYRIEEYAYCCGAGGGVKSAYPEMASFAALKRLDEAEYVLNQAAGEKSIDKLLVSVCPFCKTNFEDSLHSSGKGLKYMDINQLILELIKK